MVKIDFIHDNRVKIGWFDGSSERTLQYVYKPFWSNLLRWLTTTEAYDNPTFEYVENTYWRKNYELYCEELKEKCKKQGITEERIYRDYNITTKMYEWYWYPPHDHCKNQEIFWYGVVNETNDSINFGRLKNIKS